MRVPGRVDRSTPFGNPWPIGTPGPDGRIARDAREATQWYADWLTTQPELVERITRAYASVGEIVEIWRRRFGSFVPSTDF